MPLQSMTQKSQQLHVAQIVTAAMIGSIVIFLAVVLLQGKQAQQADPEATMAYLAAGFTVLAVFLRNILPGIIMKNARKQIREQVDGPTAQREQLANLYLTMTVIKNAMLEAPAFLVLVIYFIEPYTALPMIATSILLIMAFSFPNRTRCDDFIRTQTEFLDLEQNN